ncbi:hypothetical protein ACVILL_006911 [Bradyrhizobium sp. USDA 3364]
MGLTARDGAQRRLRGVALTLLEQARREMGAGRAIVRRQCEHAAQSIRGCGVVAMKDQDPPELVENVGASGRSIACGRQDAHGPRNVIGLMQQAPEVELQIDAVGRELKAGLYRADRLVVLAGLGDLPGEFLEGREIWRTARRRAPKLRDAVRGAPGAAQQRAEQGLDLAIIAAACNPLERSDRLPAPILPHQRVREQKRGMSVRAV